MLLAGVRKVRENSVFASSRSIKISEVLQFQKQYSSISLTVPELLQLQKSYSSHLTKTVLISQKHISFYMTWIRKYSVYFLAPVQAWILQAPRFKNIFMYIHERSFAAKSGFARYVLIDVTKIIPEKCVTPFDGDVHLDK